MKFLLALRFLTILRLPGSPREIDPSVLGRSTAYFPLVGLVVGVILCLIAWLGAMILPIALVNALVIIALVIISGGLHIDGFIDTCDGIGGQKPKEERWRIMHEGRIGAFGATGAVLILLVKFIALEGIPHAFILPTLLLLPVIGRWTMVYALFAYRYARPTGMGKVFQEQTNWVSFVTATTFTLALSMLILDLANVSLFYLLAPALMFLVLLMAMLMANYLKKKFGGLTGDCYGAVNEITESFVLILVSLVLYNGWV